MNPRLLFTVFMALVLTNVRLAAQSFLGSVDFFGRQQDARSEAMGRGNLALRGDTRNMFLSPASLIEMDGLEVYGHQASPWYVFEKSTFTSVGLAYRMSRRFALGMGYDRTELKSDMLTFGDMIDPRRGFVYQTSDALFGSAERFSANAAFALLPDLSIGAGIGNIPASADDDGLIYGTVGMLKTFRIGGSAVMDHRLRLACSMQNFSFVEERTTYTGVAGDVEVITPVPAIARLGTAYRLAWRGGWLMDSLTTLAFTAQVQYDDDLTQVLRSAIRFGGEVEIAQMLALRCGWYSETVDDFGHPEYNKDAISQFTYGVGVILPLGVLTDRKIPLTISLDCTSLPQVSFTTNDLNNFTGEAWENFESYGLRINYGIGRIFKQKPKAS